MNKTINKLTQLDYVKCLIEENRIGEALENLKTICNDLEYICVDQAERLNQDELVIPKSIVKTKPQNWMFLNETWVKMIGVSGDTIQLEVSNGITVESKFIVKRNETAK
jgi:hypothetical protein